MDKAILAQLRDAIAAKSGSAKRAGAAGGAPDIEPAVSGDDDTEDDQAGGATNKSGSTAGFNDDDDFE